jgi:hypothetical protein
VKTIPYRLISFFFVADDTAGEKKKQPAIAQKTRITGFLAILQSIRDGDIIRHVCFQVELAVQAVARCVVVTIVLAWSQVQ